MERFLASLPEKPQPLLVRVFFTVLIMGLSILVQVGIFHLSGFAGFYLLLPGIFACGLIFDRGSGFLATLMGTLFGVYVTPWTPGTVEQGVPLMLFAIVGFATALASEALRNVMEKLAKAEYAKDLLLRELDHRAHNNMMSMASVLRLQARVASNSEAKDALRSSANRIQVMANVHTHLAPSNLNRAVNMKQYLEDLCQKLEEMRAQSGVTIKTQSEQIILSEKEALPIGFIVNELVTNCLKYAFPDNRQGCVDVHLKTDGDLILRVTDDGVGLGGDVKEGVGTRLIAAMADQLDATLTYENTNPGCRITVRVPQSH